ncbi:TerB family tellurite resistance protein [Xanthobacter flavus]
MDESAARSLNEARQKLTQLSLPEFKTLVRDQFYILLLERETAVEAIAHLVTDPGQRQELVNTVAGVATADGAYTPGERVLVERLADLLGVSAPKNVALAAVNTAPAPVSGQSLPAAV